jgi:hypothetical protein
MSFLTAIHCHVLQYILPTVLYADPFPKNRVCNVPIILYTKFTLSTVILSLASMGGSKNTPWHCPFHTFLRLHLLDKSLKVAKCEILISWILMISIGRGLEG